MFCFLKVTKYYKHYVQNISGGCASCQLGPHLLRSSSPHSLEELRSKHGSQSILRNWISIHCRNAALQWQWFCICIFVGCNPCKSPKKTGLEQRLVEVVRLPGGASAIPCNFHGVVASPITSPASLFAAVYVDICRYSTLVYIYIYMCNMYLCLYVSLSPYVPHVKQEKTEIHLAFP